MIHIKTRRILIVGVTCLALLIGELFAPNKVQADIAVVLSAKSAVNELTQKQVIKMFLGKMRIFPGSRRPVLAYDLPASDPLRWTFYKHIVGMRRSQLARYRASYLFSGKGRLPEEVENVEALVKELESHDSGVGYMDLSEVTEAVKVVYVLKTDEGQQ